MNSCYNERTLSYPGHFKWLKRERNCKYRELVVMANAKMLATLFVRKSCLFGRPSGLHESFLIGGAQIAVHTSEIVANVMFNCIGSRRYMAVVYDMV
jgi:hypothetical protein